jgi:DNA-binding MurR/RpiR family transcriptional regulator
MHLEDSDLYEQAARMILEATRIFVLGYGAAGGIAVYCQFRLTELGLTAMYNSDHHMVTPILAQPNPGDLIIAISKSGETLDILQPLQNMPVGVAKIMAITSNEDSPLARMSDLVLPTHTDDVNLVTDSMNTRAIQMLIVDTLFSIVSIQGGKAAHDRLLKTRKAFYDARVPGSSQRSRTRG